jgi:putative hydrolase of the HAD superfamily
MAGRAVIRGILFDSGHTLIHPRDGEWFPGHRFRAIVGEHCPDELAWERLEDGLSRGMTYLDAVHALQSVEEERAQFVEYYRLLLAEMGHISPTPELLHALASSLVDELAVDLYPDVVPALETLRARGLKLGIISDSWPSLDPKYVQLGVRHYFDAFVISAQLGCVKPDERMYRRGLADLALAPEEVLFVDDWPGHVEAAIALGMHGAVMDRMDRGDSGDLPRVTSMADVLALLD